MPSVLNWICRGPGRQGSTTWGRRELPVRLAEYGTCYRYEKSGELFGLMRVRSMQMNDAHIYCSEEQFEQEFMGVIALFAMLGAQLVNTRYGRDAEPTPWRRLVFGRRSLLRAPLLSSVDSPAAQGPTASRQRVWRPRGPTSTSRVSAATTNASRRR